jgi:hypothetical protein
MEEQINISALGIVCLRVHIVALQALYGYTSRKGESKIRQAQVEVKQCLEKHASVRQYQTVP